MTETKYPLLSIVPHGGSGIEIRALMGKPYNCVEFVMDRAVPQPIFYSPWIQFEPTEFHEDRHKIAMEMVRRYNAHEALIAELDKARRHAAQERTYARKMIDEYIAGAQKYYDDLKAKNPTIELP